MKAFIQSAARKFGIEISRTKKYRLEPLKPADMPASLYEIQGMVKEFTMISTERLFANVSAIEYVSKNRIAGAIIECGVWRGGSMMAMLETLRRCGDTGREAYLFDTFAGMTEPTQFDQTGGGESAAEKWARLRQGQGSDWCRADLEDVTRNLANIDYPRERIHLVKGDVLATLPLWKPVPIAVLRLDTDWYESTKAELEHFYDHVVPGGVILIDDYGRWQGARKAVDEFLASRNIFPLLTRTDRTGRLWVKSAA